MKKYAISFLLTVVVTLVFNVPILIWNDSSLKSVWEDFLMLVGLGVLGVFFYVTRVWMWIFGGIQEESVYFFAIFLPLTIVIIQGIAMMVFSYYDGGIFTTLDLKGWFTLFAGILAFATLFWLPQAIVKFRKARNETPTNHSRQRR